MLKRALLIVAGAVGTCAPLSSAGSSPTQPATTSMTGARAALSAQAERGWAFAQSHCAACHGIAAGKLSPNPESPPFEAIANTPGLTRATFREFLRDSHNFPDAMKFSVAPEQIDDITEYMLTLRAPGYRPGI
jgi:mono/diheme cytochrome c family protein